MSKTRRDVLLVPGFAGGNTFFLPFRDELRMRGLKADCWHGSPVVYRRKLAWYGERLARDIIALESRAITLVGWSMGGFVSVDAMRYPEAAAKVRRVIAYATPFDGTWAARLGGLFDPLTRFNIREMAADGTKRAELIDVLHSRRSWDFLAVNGTRDWLARGPLKSLAIELCLTGDFDHRSLLWNPALFELIHSLIIEP